MDNSVENAKAVIVTHQRIAQAIADLTVGGNQALPSSTKPPKTDPAALAASSAL